MATLPTTIAHRGFTGCLPENTVAAVRGAVDHGADVVEVDVMPTGDGDVVVFHDDHLGDAGESRGITDREGLVWERPTDVVTAARVLGTDQRVPTLADVVAALPPDVALNVELKNPGTAAIRPFEALSGRDRDRARERWTPFVDRVLSVTEECTLEVLFSSFCEGALATVRAHRPDARLAALFGRRDWGAGATVARRYDVDALHVPLEQADHPNLADLSAALGAAVNVWTVRDWQDARRALAAGADGIIADYPGLHRCVSD
ncbi:MULTISPECIES: glycerophosphodiester phosphodiesterase [Haloarcula]|uniref:glycerophosphodiester phosphodiesterase n=1 Tax=Haloarcula TaxID=2237 RepID=UPI0023EB0D0D|nr:glycerophosphodiester phosphodiesterase [Halomicroarcula sp. XH51]